MLASPPVSCHAQVESILKRYGFDPFNLLQILIEVQEAWHCVPPEAMDLIGAALFPGDRLRVPSVLSFYSFLSPTYLGDYVIRLSDNITDQMLGNRDLGTRLCRRLGVAPGQVRSDGRVSVHYTSCTGMPDQGPAALVNGLTVTRLTSARVDLIAELVAAGTPLPLWPAEFFRVADNIQRRDVLLGEALEPGAAIRACQARGAEATLQELHQSNLRGRGGAGFPAARKWQAARDHPATQRYVLCNADEGEPGTFKDRVLLQSCADLVFEGMTVAGLAIQARQGILYLRGEYRYLKASLEAVLARRRAVGLLGGGVPFEIQIHWGAGAYICGMETAMIESIEGKRGIPRKRFPLPVHDGYLGGPSIVNNVETFAAAAHIALRGGAWFAGIGTPQSTGTKLFCVSGDCERPGLYEYPWGLSCRELLDACGARDTQYLQISGPSGMTVPAREFHRRLAFEDLPGVGTVMIFDRTRDLFAMSLNFARFFRHESCGLCTPCRVGTTLVVELLEKLEAGRGSPADLEELRTLAQVMIELSHCGLGQTAPLHLLDALEKFPEVLRGRALAASFQPAFDLDAALAEARGLSGRNDPEPHL